MVFSYVFAGSIYVVKNDDVDCAILRINFCWHVLGNIVNCFVAIFEGKLNPHLVAEWKQTKLKLSFNDEDYPIMQNLRLNYAASISV